MGALIKIKIQPMRAKPRWTSTNGSGELCLDLPLPGGRRRPRVDVDVDGVALLGGRHEHVLAGVVAANHWRGEA